MRLMVYDVAIIGAGPGGYVAAIRGSQLGGRICVIEQEEVGGTCLQLGCIPTKALISSVELLRRMRDAEKFGLRIEGDIRPDIGAIFARKDQIVANLTQGIRLLFKANRVNLIKGQARVVSPGRILVRSAGDAPAQTIEAKSIIIATGSKPASIAGLELDGVSIISSDEAVKMQDVPGRLLIVGAGAIGCEFAFIFRQLGSEITMVELMPQVLPQEDAEIARVIERELKKERIKVFTGTRVESVREGDDQFPLLVRLSNGQEVGADKILVSIGRQPNTAELGLDKLGIQLGSHNEIVVNRYLETNIKGIYAIGDVIGGIMLAHVASAEGIVAVENALGGNREMDYRVVPAGIFTSPEIGRVGLTEQQARERGQDIKIGRFPLRALGRAQAMGELTGLIKIISDAETGEILGGHIVGPSATELIHEIALAMCSDISCEELAELIHIHPTLSEGLMEAAHDVYNRAINIPPPG